MVVALIPARFASSRLPGKPLVELLGRPMIQHVYERVTAATRVDRVVVATDDPSILETVHRFGGHAVMTSTEHPSGSDRIAEALELLSADTAGSVSAVLNVQGDEPMIDPDLLNRLVEKLVGGSAACVTAVSRIESSRDLFDTNVVKVVLRDGDVPLYFSRSPIPCMRDLPPEEWSTATLYHRHIGIYAYRPDALRAFVAAPPSSLETAEQLEQLRLLELGLEMRVVRTEYAGHSVDTPEDVMRVEELMRVSQ